MALFYVYSPFTGQMWAQTYYCYCCNNGPHTYVGAMGGGGPIDIGVSGNAGGTAVYFYGSLLVKSIRTTQYLGVCATQTGVWNQFVKVELFAGLNAQDLVGYVSYGHVTNRVANGVYNTNLKQIGTLPPNMCTDPAGTAQCNCSTNQPACCSNGVHSHIQANGVANPFSCGQTLYANSTWFAKWTAY